MDALTNETPPPVPGWTVASSSPVPLPGAVPTNGLAVAALVLGVLAMSLAVNVVLFLAAVPVGLAALVLGVLGTRRAGEAGVGKGQAIAGAITGGLGAAAGLLLIAGAVTLFSGDVASAGGSAATSACADVADRRPLAGEYRAGDYTFTGVEVCSDSFDDFAFSATVRNDGPGTAAAALQIQAVAGGAVLGGATATTAIAPGTSARVDFISFDDYRSDWTDVMVGAR